MHSNKSRAARDSKMLVLGALTVCLTVVGFADRADAIPVFARKYQTSCITCHAGFPKLNSVGEAFRRNGYQFPRGDEDQVKDFPIPLGTEAWKEMWPDTIWPNDIPHLPPVAFRARLGFNTFTDGPGGSPVTDFRFPQDYSILSAGTLGENISWYAGYVLAGKGAHGGGGHGGHGDEEAGLEGELERMFVQFNNLFAWADEDDEDGMRLANRWIAMPKHAMNLRVGQFEPGVIAPWASIHRQLGLQGRLPNLASIGGNSFTFEPALRGIELNGVFRNYNSYAIGLVNGRGIGGAWDNNDDKDYYFRVARKWWGYPLDGQVADVGAGGVEPEVEPEVEVGMLDDFRVYRLPNIETVRGQSPDGDILTSLPGLDFWRETSFETGFFGYFGRNMASVTTHADVEVLIVGGGGATLEIEVPTTTMRLDQFERIGFDARWQYRDWDIFGAWIWGWDSDPISDEDPAAMESDELFTWFVEVDYYFKPWLIGYTRYEELGFRNEERHGEAAISRAVVGAAAYIATNVRLIGEAVVDARGSDTTNDSVQFMLDLAF